MVAIIVATDQLVWRPVIAWSDKFKFEQLESGTRVRSPILHLLQHSRGLSVRAAYAGAAGRAHLPVAGETSAESQRVRRRAKASTRGTRGCRLAAGAAADRGCGAAVLLCCLAVR